MSVLTARPALPSPDPTVTAADQNVARRRAKTRETIIGLLFVAPATMENLKFGVMQVIAGI